MRLPFRMANSNNCQPTLMPDSRAKRNDDMDKPTIAITILLLTCPRLWAAEKQADKAQPAGPRSITAKEYLSYPPLFTKSAHTFDPMDLARESWKGWVSKRGTP